MKKELELRNASKYDGSGNTENLRKLVINLNDNRILKNTEREEKIQNPQIVLKYRKLNQENAGMLKKSVEKYKNSRKV